MLQPYAVHPILVCCKIGQWPWKPSNWSILRRNEWDCWDLNWQRPAIYKWDSPFVSGEHIYIWPFANFLRHPSKMHLQNIALKGLYSSALNGEAVSSPPKGFYIHEFGFEQKTSEPRSLLQGFIHLFLAGRNFSPPSRIDLDFIHLHSQFPMVWLPDCISISQVRKWLAKWFHPDIQSAMFNRLTLESFEGFFCLIKNKTYMKFQTLKKKGPGESFPEIFEHHNTRQTQRWEAHGDLHELWTKFRNIVMEQPWGTCGNDDMKGGGVYIVYRGFEKVPLYTCFN